ncbi:MAG TPA: polysaccharide deacetylase family protein [Candidatus Baltobacteraceae bacterium]|jgi:peptidoglycan/xylan/chitin deacetylase (PgdA/CDA1 family)|nr:polysaccharide deacetylase family protein [Candidatus Baltobacteraceae bacterium]
MIATKRGTAVRLVLALAVAVPLVFAAYEVTENPGNQLFGKTVVSGPANERVVALTYDDGPNPPYTSKILDVLDREHVHATFFLVGKAVVAYPNVARREVRDGDAIGNHSWSHDHLIVLAPNDLRNNLRRTDDAIFAATGVHTHIMRPPYGARDWLVLDQARRLGYTPVMWSVPLARDWEYPPAAVIAKRILPHVRDGSIIVLHDGNRGMICTRAHANTHLCDRSADIGATRLIVEALKAQGYRFVTIPELLALKGTMHTPAPGGE